MLLVALGLGCAPDASDVPSALVTVEYSEMALTAHWSTAVPADAWLEFGADASYGSTRAGWSSEDGLEHAAVLAGVDSRTEWHWRVTSEGDEAEFHSADASFRPDDPPQALPDLAVSGEYEGLIVGAAPGVDNHAVIYNGEGRPVWWRHLSDTMVSATQARLSDDGRSVLVLAQDQEEADQSWILRYALAGGEPEVLEVPGAHHDFVALATGGFAALVADVRTVDGYDVQGDALVEFASDGSSQMLWSVWDHEGPENVSMLVALASGARDWSHFNSLSAANGVYWLSSYGLSAIYTVDADTGEQIAKIGGGNPDYHRTDDVDFGPQHSPIATEAGMLLFNNGILSSPAAYSEVVEYSIDHEAHTYTRLWSYDADRSIRTMMLGNVDALAGGGHLVVWGSAGQATILDDEGEPQWEAVHPLGSTFGYAHAAAELSASP